MKGQTIMSENKTPENNKENIEELLYELDGRDKDSFVYLSDEDGKEYPFEFLDVITYNDEDYAIFFPAYDEDESGDDEDSVVILKVIPNDDGSADFISSDDTATLDAVFEIFMENLRRSFEIDGEQA